MAKKPKVSKKKEQQAARDRLASKLNKQQSAVTSTTASDDEDANSEQQQQDQHRLCPHLRSLPSARFKPLADDVQTWLSKQVTATADDIPTALCLDCGYQGPLPPAQPDTQQHADTDENKEQVEGTEKDKEAHDELKQPHETQPTDDTEQQPTTPPASSPAPSADASHFRATHFIGLRLSSQPSLADCICFRCNVTLADSLIESPQHARLTKLAAFVTSLFPTATTSPLPSTLASSSSTAPSVFSASPSATVLSSSNLSSLSVGSSMRGLSNLGNTCFFNSVVQCLAASRPLLTALHPPPATPLPLQHQLTLFLTNMNTPLSSLSSLPANKRNSHHKPTSLPSSSSSSYSPGALLSAVQGINPQFKGGRQQDAHELLRCVLSALVTEGEEKERKRRRDELVAVIRQWGVTDVERVLASAGMRGGCESEVKKRLEDIAAKEKGGGGEGTAVVVDGAVVLMLLEKWETKDGKRWRKALSEGLDDEDKKRLERCFTSMRQGKLPLPTTAPDSTSAADSDADEEGAEEEEDGVQSLKKSRRSVTLPLDSVVHRVFGGVMEQCVTCLSCGAASWTEEVFFDLSLPIEPPRPIELRKKEERRPPIASINTAKPRAAAAAVDKLKRESEQERKAKEEEATQRERVKQEQSAKQAAEKDEKERQYLLRLEEAQREDVTVTAMVRRKKQQPAQFARKGGKLSQAEKKKMKEKERRKSGGRVGADTAQRQEEKEEEEEQDDMQGVGNAQDEDADGGQDERKEHSELEERTDVQNEDDSSERKEVRSEDDGSKKVMEVDERKEEAQEERTAQVEVGEESSADSAANSNNIPQLMDEQKQETHFPSPAPHDNGILEQKQDVIISGREVIDLTGDSDDDKDATLARLSAQIDDLSVTEAAPHTPTSSPATDTTPAAGPSSTSALSVAPSSSASSATSVSRLSGACTMWDCLQSFFDPELLTGSNQFNCSSCSSLVSLASTTSASSSIVCKRDATRRYYLRLLPAVLTIHLKRFSASASGRSMEKLNKSVSFPAQLDLTAFTRPSTTATDGGGSGGSVYGLYGVVCHSGGMGGGHYVCYVRRGGGSWWYASDSAVREATEGEVLKAQAYILFYQRLSTERLSG